MTDKEIEIAFNYLNQLSGHLPGPLTHTQLELTHNELHELIKRLMEDTFRETDDGKKVKLALLEMRARECMELVRERLMVRN